MLADLKYFYQNINRKAMGIILPTVLLPIIALRLLGFLQPAEWAAYDLLFHFSQSEPMDERIVLVNWKEVDIQMLEETTMSDRTLSFVIEKIKEQKPRLIGLDLYRDVPVTSRLLSNEENDAAYKRLMEIFRSTPNLIGIEKVREPIINTSTVLKEEGRVASSDLVLDPDGIIRRAYIDPQAVLDQNDSKSVKSAPYIGTALGGEYLVQEGWKFKNIDKGSLMFFKDKQQIILEQLKTFDGGYVNNQYGLDFLINWRKGDNQFFQVSIADLMADSIPQDLFHDKIVIIGNSASSTADRHNLPIERWNKNFPQWTYGVEIPAHVASSIISAALNDRPLIRIAPGGIGYWLLAIFSSLVTSIVLKYSTLRIRRCLLISGFFGLGLILLSMCLSYWAFQFGWWLPIVPSILGVLGAYIISHSYVQIAKERQNVSRIRLLASDLDHQLGNTTNSIKLGIEGQRKLLQLIYDKSLEDFQNNQESGFFDKDILFKDTPEGQNLILFQEKIQATLHEIELITEYRKRITQFIQPASLQKNKTRIASINPSVQQIVEQVTKKKQAESQYHIPVQENYDPALKKVKIDLLTMEIVLENLLDNAIYAIVARQNQESCDYLPKIIIQTKKRRNFIEITVQDNGIGIPQHLQQRIFEPFVSYRVGRGQGIGLAIVKELLSLERGQITVKSQLQVGSKFTFSIPKKN